MKHMIWKLSLLFLLVACMLFAASCERGKTPGGEETQPIDVGALIAGENQSVYSIVYPTKWTDNEYNAAKDIESALKEKYASVPEVKNDKTEGVDGAYEILIGNTNRSESATVLEGLNEYGWTIRVIGNRIVINAKNDMLIPDAVAYFISTYIGRAKEIGINSIAEHVENNEKYNHSFVFSVGNHSVYSLSCSAKSSAYLKSSVAAFEKAMKKNGITLFGGKAVKVTTSSAITGWEINFEENGDITVKGETDALAAVALNYLSSEVLKKDADGDIIIQDPQKIANLAEEYDREGWELAVPAYEGGCFLSACTIAERA